MGTAVVSSACAAAINVATGDPAAVWAWSAVGVLTVTSGLWSWQLSRGVERETPPAAVEEQGPRSAATTDPRPRPPAQPGSFRISWSGEEPLSEYASRPHVWRFWLGAVSSSAVLLAVYVGIYLPLGLAAEDSFWYEVAVILGGFSSAAVFFLALGGLLNTASVVRHRFTPKTWSGWDVSVGPSGIVTSSAAARFEFSWNQIDRVKIEKVDAVAGYAYTGLYVDPVRGARLPPMLRPAGWPYRDSKPPARRVRGRTLVCVLGPMTERQRVQLMEALASHGGERWFPFLLSFATPPIDTAERTIDRLP
ncbi:hypothetical protein LZ318_06595 [Saccharopolyspora indica]|uniref:hypothetical protein n=1 Tax=Saccharopolyspora indica TaxID=1229659 RepID=UPI0022EB8227|nr:hypothetical protein [Saccharopolyspora indica]MDA3648685.1 hypothetical protein [Saccharopolyspora indica]